MLDNRSLRGLPLCLKGGYSILRGPYTGGISRLVGPIV
jgi:hypothetical protein